jgi:hypothetical protein
MESGISYPAVRYTEAYLQRVAATLVSALTKKDLIRHKGEVKKVEEKAVAALLRNFRQEDELEREVERVAEEHAREIQGVDRRKMMLLIKQRLAKERGIVL